MFLHYLWKLKSDYIQQNKKQKTASVSGVSRSVKNGRCWAFLRRTRRRSRRQIFPGCSSSQQMLPAIRHDFVFQQDSAPAHRARDTVKLLQHETADFISPELWPPNSPELNPVDYKIWGIMQQRQVNNMHFAADRSKRQAVTACVRRHCGSASRTHAAA